MLRIAWFALVLAPAGAWAAVPHLFFSDLESGPNTGGESNAGAYVTVYGKDFGSARGSSYVTIGGGQAAAYPVWTDTKVTFQLGAAAATGDLIVVVPDGSSNAIPFTVSRGRIFFVSPGGSDRKNGGFSSPWRTLVKARDSMRPGDITYAMNGVAQTADDGSGWNTSLLVRNGGHPAAPKAIVAYPNATATIGSVNGPATGIRTAPAEGGHPDHWVIAGFVLRGQGAAMGLWGSNGWRIVGNDISCPQGDGAAGCFDTVESSALKFYGNHVHDTGKENASSQYHAVYFGTDSNHLDIGWNTIANVHGCRGIQIHSSPQSGEAHSGQNQYDIRIHDNVIHDTQCDGIILATVDPSKGPVTVYNNVIYNAGKGPDNPERTGGWSCIYVPGYTNSGSAGSGAVEIFDNTFYGCGTFAKPPYSDQNAALAFGGGSPDLFLRIRNNIIFQTATSLFPAGVPYLAIWNPSTRHVCAAADDCRWIQGSNNLFYGSGPPPANPNITGSVNADPEFVNVSQHDFHLLGGSPARRRGVDTVSAVDQDGVPRGGAEGTDLGAFQFTGQ